MHDALQAVSIQTAALFHQSFATYGEVLFHPSLAPLKGAAHCNERRGILLLFIFPLGFFLPLSLIFRSSVCGSLTGSFILSL